VPIGQTRWWGKRGGVGEDTSGGGREGWWGEMRHFLLEYFLRELSIHVSERTRGGRLLKGTIMLEVFVLHVCGLFNVDGNI